MFSSARELNKGIEIERNKIVKNNLKYIKQYSKRCYELYDLGYISTPSIFMEDEFLSVILDEFPEYSKKIISGVNKRFVKEADYIKYVCNVIKDDKFTDIMLKYADICESIEAFDNYTNLMSHTNLRKRFRTTKVKAIILTLSSICNKSVLPLDNKYIQDVFYVEDNNIVVAYNYSDLWIRDICETCNISIDEYEYCKEHNKSLFDDRLTFEDDCNYINYLLSGDFITDNNNSKKLYDYLLNYYQIVKNNKPFLNEIFSHISSDLSERIADIKEEVKKLNGKLLYMTNFNIYFQISKSDNETLYDCDNNDESIGRYVYDSIKGFNFNIANVLNGISGEFISEDAVKNRGYNTRGLAIEINDYTRNGKCVVKNYFPIYNVFDKDGKNIIYPYYGYKRQLGYANLEEIVYNILEIDDLSDLEYKLKNKYQDLSLDSARCIKGLIYNLCNKKYSLDFLKNYDDKDLYIMYYNVNKYYNSIINEIGG